MSAAGFDSSHRVPAGQIPPFFLPRVGPQLRPCHLTGRQQNRFYPTSPNFFGAWGGYVMVDVFMQVFEYFLIHLHYVIDLALFSMIYKEKYALKATASSERAGICRRQFW